MSLSTPCLHSDTPPTLGLYLLAPCPAYLIHFPNPFPFSCHYISRGRGSYTIHISYPLLKHQNERPSPPTRQLTSCRRLHLSEVLFLSLKNLFALFGNQYIFPRHTYLFIILFHPFSFSFFTKSLFFSFLFFSLADVHSRNLCARTYFPFQAG